MFHHALALVCSLFFCINGISIVNLIHRNKPLAFINRINPKFDDYPIKKLNAGWGISQGYVWKENDDYVIVKIRLPLDTSSDDIQGEISKDKLNFSIKNGQKLIQGYTIKSIDVFGSFWDLVTHDLYKELTINLKKQNKFIDLWEGVIKGDAIKRSDYKSTEYSLKNVNKPSDLKRLPNSLIWQSEPYQNYDQLFSFVNGWNDYHPDDAEDDHEYGLPECKIKLFFLPEKYGAKILFGGNLIPDTVDEWIDLRVLEQNDKYHVVVSRGPETSLINGLHGLNLSIFVQQAEDEIARKLQIDLNKKFPTHSIDQTSDVEDEILNPFKDIDFSDKLIKKYFETELGFDDDWPDEKREEHKKHLIETITKLSDRKFKPGYEVETVQSLCAGIQNALSLNNQDMNNLFNDAIKRIENRKLELSNNNTNSSIPLTDDSFQLNFDHFGGEQTRFERAMDLNNSSILSDKYHSLPKKCQELIKERWEQNANKLDKLIQELLNCEESLIPTICDNYKDLLLSEDYPSIMKSKLSISPPQNEFEKSRFMKLQQFVMSLYKDLEIYMLNNEINQLDKINQICQIAMTNIYGVDDFMFENKSKYDMEFICYLKFAMHRESQNLLNNGINPELEPSVWLMILQLIYKGVTYLIRDDISEHTEIITIIIGRSLPLLRKYMTEYYLACMPKSDWKEFKDTVNTIANGISKMSRHDIFAESPDLQEWIPDAILQLQNDVEELVPDWVIEGMLSPSDRVFMEMSNNRKIPVCQLNLNTNSEQKLLSTKALDKTVDLHDKCKIPKILIVQCPMNSLMHSLYAKHVTNLTKRYLYTVNKRCNCCDYSKIYVCSTCHLPINDLTSISPYNLFKLPMEYKIDKRVLRNKYLQYQNYLHPDKYLGIDKNELDLITSGSSYVNHAYKLLMDDKARGLELLSHLNQDTKLDDSNIGDIFDIHEEIDSLTENSDALKLKRSIDERIDKLVNEVNGYFIENNYDQVRSALSTLGFLQTIRNRLDCWDDQY